MGTLKALLRIPNSQPAYVFTTFDANIYLKMKKSINRPKRKKKKPPKDEL
jgi:hypothetical protein